MELLKSEDRHWDTIIIGGGQAGLAMGYHLKQINRQFMIMDAGREVGESWSTRWDSLRLFSPSLANNLPGMDSPGKGRYFASKDETANYLKRYADKFKLPVMLNTKITSLTKTKEGYELMAGEMIFTCHNVVVATGAYGNPKIPDIAKELEPGIHQLHSSAYLRPADLPDGDVLVVGAGNSGLQIALDVKAAGINVCVSGIPPGQLPWFLYRYCTRFFFWVQHNVLTIDKKPGRAIKKTMLKGAGAPLVSTTAKQVEAAGIRILPRVTGQKNGFPVLENETTVLSSVIIWCTGFKNDYSWIKLDRICDEYGYPDNNRGVSNYDGLYFMGALFQYGVNSNLLGGVGRDAGFIANHIEKRENKSL